MNKRDIELIFGGTGKAVATALGISARAWYGYTDPLPQRVINQVRGVMAIRKMKVKK